MAVYPFYVSTVADGRKTLIQGGTKRKDGDMTTTIFQRDCGGIIEPFQIRQYSTYDENEAGELEHHLHTVVKHFGEVIKEYVTDY